MKIGQKLQQLLGFKDLENWSRRFYKWRHIYLIELIVLGFNDTSALVGHFGSSPGDISGGHGTQAINQSHKSVNEWRIKMFRPTDMDPRIKGEMR